MTWNETSYKHWGVAWDGSLEPNFKDIPEDCSAGNASEAFGGVFGWSDARCDLTMIFVCRLIRGWLQRGGVPVKGVRKGRRYMALVKGDHRGHS